MSDEERSITPEDADTNPQKLSRPWSGSLRITPILIAIICASSISVFGLAISAALQVYSAPLDMSLSSYPFYYRWSIGWYIAYFTIAPFVSILCSLLDLTLYFFARLNPTYTALGSTVMAVGWILQLVFWLQCDFVADLNQCQQFYLVHDNRTSFSGAIVGVATNVTYAKVAFGFVLVALYVVYLVSAANAIHQKSRARRSQSDAATKIAQRPFRRDPRVNRNVNATVFYA